ncbi:threonine--tRNA ligase [Candidatus Uhrbacteria bacterium]|nr:threonine--tRNA ligase [Candidatus Uhrbacteria bacterium]
MPNVAVETLRHSTAHLLAAAVTTLWPKTRLGVGPVIEHGFYYDMDVRDVAGQPVRLTPDDLPKLEATMRAMIAQGDAFRRVEMPIAEAMTLFRDRGQDFKVELLTDLATKGTTSVRPEEQQDLGERPDAVSLYWTGSSFVDLCRGPHVATASDLGVFALTKIAGAYWRGKDTNPQLQRIYGFAFATAEELAAHLHMLAEAEKRDHKKLGPQLDLFVFSDLVGSGLPLWTPKGTLVRSLLSAFVWDLRKARGYERVEIPHITKKDLYERSGHWEKYKDDLFKITTREQHEFAMKPMNCPHHTQIYARKLWSYRELPQRYENTTMVYRDEQSGELAGLSRVLSITQDDAHIFCRITQVKAEIQKIWEIVHTFYGAFGMELRLRLSLRDPQHLEKYLGNQGYWDQAETMLREVADENAATYVVALGEAAFYAPKLDFIAKDSIGREWQVATIQIDMNMPERVDLTCVGESGDRERIVMIHAAIMGSIERFLSVLIEHYAGAFPVWLAPVQVAVLPVGERHTESARTLVQELCDAGLRVEFVDATETVGKRIRQQQQMKVPYMIVWGDREMASTELSIRMRGQEELLTMSRGAFLERVRQEMVSRSM